MPLAREHHPRVLVLDRDRDVRERLVVAQPHVERRPVPLDEVLLEVQRLDLAAGDDHLDVRHPAGELPDLGPAVAGLLEVRAHARPQRVPPYPRRGSRPRRRGTGRRPLSREASSLFLRPVRHGHGYRSRAHDRHKGTARRDPRRCARPRSGGARGRPRAWSSAPPRTPSARRRLVQAKAQMDLAVARRLPGRADHRRPGRPASTAVSKTDTAILRNVAAAAKLDRHAGADHGDELRQRDDAAQRDRTSPTSRRSPPLSSPPSRRCSRSSSATSRT